MAFLKSLAEIHLGGDQGRIIDISDREGRIDGNRIGLERIGIGFEEHRRRDNRHHGRIVDVGNRADSGTRHRLGRSAAVRVGDRHSNGGADIAVAESVGGASRPGDGSAAPQPLVAQCTEPVDIAEAGGIGFQYLVFADRAGDERQAGRCVVDRGHGQRGRVGFSAEGGAAAVGRGVGEGAVGAAGPIPGAEGDGVEDAVPVGGGLEVEAGSRVRGQQAGTIVGHVVQGIPNGPAVNGVIPVSVGGVGGRDRDTLQ